MQLKSKYSLSDNLTPAQFEELRQSGDINPNATYQDFLALAEERRERRRRAEEEAQRLEYELHGPELDLTLEDEAILDQVWTNLARKNLREELAA